jgi:G patch domain-containing protein 1
VGSKEGWAPSTFISSRSNRAAKAQQQQVEDFMDEEDLREAEESKQLETSGDFAAFGSTQSYLTGRGGIMDLLKAGGETMGVKLLKKMGWREGQGIGPKVRRRADLGDAAPPGGEEPTHLFAPENAPTVTFVRKTDHKGLGFEGEARLESSLQSESKPADNEDEDDADSFFSQRLDSRKKPKEKKTARRGAFGVGVLNDTGSDDEDPYSMGPQISYNRTIGGDKKKKKSKGTDGGKLPVGSANPLLSSKPVFISKKTSLAGFRKCHDGRLPLDGFTLADAISNISLSSEKTFSPPQIPQGWKSSKTPTADRDTSTYTSTANTAKASKLDPKSRAELLGEDQLPGKSIFDWMTPEAREKIAKLTGRTNLPPALGEKAPKGYEMSDAEKRRNLWDLVPNLDKAAAVQALERAVGGWMPYSEDENKRQRYRSFLEVRAGLKEGLPDRLPGSTTNAWAIEMHEFARAAEVFRPVSGVMASRFTSASTAPKLRSDQPDTTSSQSLLSRPAAKPEDPAEAAAKIGMFGQMTRSTLSFFPTRLLCKRLNIKPPAHVQLDPGDVAEGESRPSARPAGSSSRLDLVSQDVMNQLLSESATAATQESGKPAATPAPIIIEPEKNEALEAERPGEAVFKAIFGSDDESEEE